jgi:hypothetical protein
MQTRIGYRHTGYKHIPLIGIPFLSPYSYHCIENVSGYKHFKILDGVSSESQKMKTKLEL